MSPRCCREMSSEQHMKTLGDAVKNTLLTPNEARKRENLPPLAGAMHCLFSSRTTVWKRCPAVMP